MSSEYREIHDDGTLGMSDGEKLQGKIAAYNQKGAEIVQGYKDALERFSDARPWRWRNAQTAAFGLVDTTKAVEAHLGDTRWLKAMDRDPHMTKSHLYALWEDRDKIEEEETDEQTEGTPTAADTFLNTPLEKIYEAGDPVYELQARFGEHHALTQMGEEDLERRRAELLAELPEDKREETMKLLYDTGKHHARVHDVLWVTALNLHDKTTEATTTEVWDIKNMLMHPTVIEESDEEE